MAGLKIAMINGIMPMAGSGDGITEYAYSMYLQLKRRNRVGLVYAIERARKNDVGGLIRINSMLSTQVKRAAREEYDIYHIMNQEVGFAAADLKSTSRSGKVVTTIHDISRFENGLHRGALQRAYNAMIKRSVSKAIKNSDFLIFDSKQTMREVGKRFGTVNGAVVNIGIDKRFSGKMTRKRNEAFTVGYIGSFAHHKNVAMVLAAASIMKNADVDFRIYGAGTEEGSLAAFAERNGLQRLTMAGFAPESRKVQIYDSFDAFVFPSLYEGFGLPILEAQARGLPVIIYRRGKIPDEVRKYCFEAEDEAHMAQIIEGLRENGYNEKRRKTAMAYARSFTWDKCAKETLKVYAQVLGNQ